MVRIKTTPLRSRKVIRKKIGDSSPAVRSYRLTKQRYKNTKVNRRRNRVGRLVYKYVIGRDRDAIVDFQLN